MPIQVRGVLVHAMSGTELSRVRTEFRLRLPEPINKSPLESRGPTLLCNQVPLAGHKRSTGMSVECPIRDWLGDRRLTTIGIYKFLTFGKRLDDNAGGIRSQSTR